MQGNCGDTLKLSLGNKVNSDKYDTTSKSADLVLEETICPVARMRLLSTGVGVNNRIFSHEEVTGDKGCLACGNCVDACPVVRDKKRFIFLHNQRTSMSLESIVDMECRRCYACVRACPQVSKQIKEYVLGLRRPEKYHPRHFSRVGILSCGHWHTHLPLRSRHPTFAPNFLPLYSHCIGDYPYINASILLQAGQRAF